MKLRDESPDEDLLILVDTLDNVIGFERKARCHEGEGLLHRAFSILLFNHRKQVLLQKRSRKKPLWPLFWSSSVCSHPRKGESREQAAARRLEEELGIKAPLTWLFTFQYRAAFAKEGSENEICSVYVGKGSEDFRIDTSEIADLKYVPEEEVNRDLSDNARLYTPWFILEWTRIQRDRRSRLWSF